MEFILNEYHRNVPDEELLADIKKVVETLKTDTLMASEYKKQGNYSLNTIRRHFGSWDKALELCGIQTKKIDTDKLLEDIRRVAKLLNKETISSVEYQEHGTYTRAICSGRFSTWNETLKQAGLKPFERVLNLRIEDEALLKEIERIWIMLGRQPTTTDIKKGISHYSLHAYAEHFGGWRGALQAFVKYINEEESVEKHISVNKTSSNENIVVHSKVDVPFHKTPRDVNYRLRFKVMQRDQFKCCFCGKSPAKDSSVELQVDHIIPWAKGGETVIDNLQTLCSFCNSGKSDLNM